MHIKYLVILTGSFQMVAILVLSFDLLSCPDREMWRLHIEQAYVSFLYLHTHNATVTF